MSDSTQRRGTDYDTLRGMGAGAGSRVPRTADDPLEELARLVSQNEPVKPSPQAAAGEPRSTYTAAPRAPQATERFDAPPPYATRPAAPQPQAFESRDQQRAYGVSAQQGYGPSDDFFDDLEPIAPRGGQNDRSSQNDYGYPSHTDDFDAGYDSGFQARSPFQDDFDDLPHQPYADDGDMDEAPVRRRGAGMLVKLSGVAAALALVLGGGVWAFGALTGGATDGTPPVIKAENTTPVKVVPEAKPVVRAKESYDRVDPNANANVVTSVEEPGEKPTAPRVILPGAPTQGTQERVVETTSASLAPQSSSASEPELDANGHRRVKTLVIRPDGSPAPAEPPSSVQALAAPETPAPTPIQGSGEAAGMSMQPTRDFGIMAPEQPSAPQQQTAALAEVPMPMPRPSIAELPQPPAPTAQNDPFARQEAAPQTRAATQFPAPQPGGPPSSPQPQVQVTNKRPLKPVNPPGRQSAIPSSSSVAAASPAAQPRSAAPRPVATTPAPIQPARPTQVAMASPVATSSVAAPQIATVAGSSGGAFGVQLTAQRSEQEAIAAFNAIKQRNPGVLGNFSPAIARADLGPDRGVFYRAMVPAASQSEAANLCIQFKAAGVDCIVQRR